MKSRNNYAGRAFSGKMIRCFSMQMLLFLFCSQAMAEPVSHARAEMLADVSAVAPGSTFKVGIRLTMDPGWHVYWLNPGDAGQPPEVTWNLPPGFKADELKFPTPSTFEEAGGIAGYGYDNEVLLTSTIHAPADMEPGGEIRVAAHVTWLVCEHVCIPGEADVELILPVASAAVRLNEDVFAKWAARLPVPAEAAAGVRTLEPPSVQPVGEGGMARVVIDWAVKPNLVEWFSPPSQDLAYTDIRIETAADRTILSFRVKPLVKGKFSAGTFESVLAYTLDGQRHGLAIPVIVLPAPDAAGRVSKP